MFALVFDVWILGIYIILTINYLCAKWCANVKSVTYTGGWHLNSNIRYGRSLVSDTIDKGNRIDIILNED